MERAEKYIIHLDTHVVMWLLNGDVHLLSAKVDALLAREKNLFISPMVLLELQYMNEINRLKKPVRDIVKWLEEHSLIKIAKTSFAEVVENALSISWTRDTFDRLITASAQAENAWLITKDRVINEHYKKVVW